MSYYDEETDGPYVVITGGVGGPENVYGPFPSIDRAEKWVDEYEGGEADIDKYLIRPLWGMDGWNQRNPEHNTLLDVDPVAKVFFATCSVCGRLPYTCPADVDNVPTDWDEQRTEYVRLVRNHESDPAVQAQRNTVE